MENKIATLEQMEYGLSESKEKLILENTPAKYIKKRVGRGNMMLDYVETGYIISKLNEVFKYMWSFEVKEKQVNQSLTQVSVLGRLTGHLIIPNTGGQAITQSIVKEQFGGAEIKKFSSGHPMAGSPIDIADDFKAASSDALKKCASMLGIAQDVFWKSAREEKAKEETVKARSANTPNYGENSSDREDIF